MKTILLTITFIFSSFLFSQEVSHLDEINPEGEFENISIKKLDSDSNSTSFVIWVKKAVKSHKHEFHSELIYVIDGEGLMTIAGKEFQIAKGDYFRIPENTYHALKVTSKEPIKVLSVQSPEFLGKDRVFEDEH